MNHTDMMNQTSGGMVGGIWFWTVIGILAGLLLYAMIKLLKK